MATYMYYLGHDPTTLSPPSNELSSIDAESPAAAVSKLRSEGRLPQDWQSLWVHVLVWTSDDGEQRGFESMRLANVAHSRS
jgi:hypothetical protein